MTSQPSLAGHGIEFGDIREIPVSVLAYVGDAVYELAVRVHFAAQGGAKSGILHRRAVQLVRSSAQAEAARHLQDCLTEDEAAVFRRGRNSQPPSRPRNADPAQYLAATGFEAVIGYLYLKGENSRLNQLLAMILEDHPNGET
jgi:ribonuclease III family protein